MSKSLTVRKLVSSTHRGIPVEPTYFYHFTDGKTSFTIQREDLLRFINNADKLNPEPIQREYIENYFNFD